ncbi:hypothetical protein D3C85_1341720 [compost metagenome]
MLRHLYDASTAQVSLIALAFNLSMLATLTLQFPATELLAVCLLGGGASNRSGCSGEGVVGCAIAGGLRAAIVGGSACGAGVRIMTLEQFVDDR